MPKQLDKKELRLLDATSAYHARENPKILPLAAELPVSYHQLRGRIHGRISPKSRISTTKALNEDQEEALLLWINILDDAGAPPNSKRIQECANAILFRGDPTRLKPLNKNWVYAFLRRIPPRTKLNWIVQKPKERRRIEAEDISLLTAWYERFEMFVRSNKLEPRQIYNFDETGYQIGQGQSEKVLSKSPTAYLPNGGVSEGITGIECIAIDGWTMSPWFLVKGKYHMESWYKTTSLPDDYTIATTLNGYTTDEIGIQWIKSFHEATKHRVKGEEKRLLLMDNHHSHRTPDFILCVGEQYYSLLFHSAYDTSLSAARFDTF
jgi:hypothetical protein